MSLISCVECGKLFSDKAIACPVCACPTEYILEQQRKNQQTNSTSLKQSQEDFAVEKNTLVKYVGDAEYVYVPFGIQTIGKAAFRCCRSVKTIVLPETVEQIESQAFEACLNLKEINIPPRVKTICPHTFRNCRSLSSIVLPEGIETICAYAFARCYDLDDVSLPSTIISISLYSFHACQMNNVYYNGFREEFEKLKRQHDVLDGLYRVSCKDGLWNYFDDTRAKSEYESELDEEFPRYRCERCGKEFIPAPQHVYKGFAEHYDTEEVYCSWSCFNQRDDECCPICGKLYTIPRDENGRRCGDYDEREDTYYCSWECLEKARNE